MTAAVGAALVCRDLAVTVGGATILRDLDLQVPAGTLTALVGPSGAGKTSLLRAIAGLVPTGRGTIRLGDRELAGVPSHHRRLAVVFQEPRLFPNLTVGDNVAFPLRMSGVPRDERVARAADLLDDVGLPGTAGRDPRGLSGGEQQRVALARALAGDPDLLLLDEPLSAVDPSRREDLRHLIARLQRERAVTTLYVTHDRGEAAELGDRVALLIEGRVIQHAPPEELFSRPATAVVARFFGAGNLLSGTVASGVLRVGRLRIAIDAPDGPATVALRPERLELAADGPIRGTIRTASYQGTHRRVLVDCDGVELEAHLDPDTAVAAGDEVALRVAPHHLWLLPDPSGSAATQREDRR